MLNKIYTVGVYDSNEDTFFKKLTDKKIDTFIDIRIRRGMRGPKYAFANSNYLQKKLATLGIKYLHCKELAPTDDIRSLQKQEDKKNSTLKSRRLTLSEEYVQQYKELILGKMSLSNFKKNLGNQPENIVLFCVEKEPEACHRSLAARYIAECLGVEVQHL